VNDIWVSDIWRLFRRPPRPIAPSEGDFARAESAARSLQGVLADYGKYAFDLEETTAIDTRIDCEAWRAHLLGRAPSPLGEKRAVQNGTDWDGVTTWFAGQRRTEFDYVQSSLRDLRRGLWGMIQVFSRDLHAERSADTRMKEQISHLKMTVSSNAAGDLKRAVTLAVRILEQTMDEKETRHQQQMTELAQQIGGIQSQLESARKELAVDPLTKLFNRAALDEQMGRILGIKALAGQPACLFMVDIDHFKSVNDTYGHPAGDAVLKGVAETCVRSFPRKADFVARYGGEEFAILIEDPAGPDALRLAERLLRSVREKVFAYDGREIRITASVGLAGLRPAEPTESLLRRADSALYEAKKRGRDRAVMNGPNGFIATMPTAEDEALPAAA